MDELSSEELRFARHVAGEGLPKAVATNRLLAWKVQSVVAIAHSSEFNRQGSHAKDDGDQYSASGRCQQSVSTPASRGYVQPAPSSN